VAQWTTPPVEFKLYREIVKDDVCPPPHVLLDGSPAQSDSLVVPARRYTSPAFSRLESERLWPSVWQLACRDNDIPTAGDYIEYRIANRSVLIVRTREGGLRAYRNACRHRGTTVAEGRGTAECFNCPFHGWQYSIEDGSLTDIPAGWEFSHLPQEDRRLLPVLVDAVDGYVFINFDLGAEPLRQYLGETVIEHWAQFPDAGHVKLWHYAIPVRCNWKVALEAFLEAYHLARTHPQMIAYTGDVQAEYDNWGPHSRILTPTNVSAVLAASTFTDDEILEAATELRRSLVQNPDLPVPELGEGESVRSALARAVREDAKAFGFDFGGLSDSEIFDGIEYFVFPNVVTFRSAVGHICYRFLPDPSGDPALSSFEVFFLSPMPPAVDRPKDCDIVRLELGQTTADVSDVTGFVGNVLSQDMSNMPRIQQGLNELDKVYFAERQEAVIVLFHRQLDQTMGLTGSSTGLFDPAAE